MLIEGNYKWSELAGVKDLDRGKVENKTKVV